MLTARLAYKARVLKHIVKDCYQEVDGYWVYGPINFHGFLSADDLKIIAELLDEANRLWDKEITKVFSSKES